MSPIRASLAVTLAVAALAARAEWGYRLGEPRPAQQGSFCASEEEARAVAEVFRRFGARPGYAALARAAGCATRVLAFTPRRIVAEVTLGAGGENEYVVRFVEVESEDGAVHYLFTTRAVTPR